MILLFTTATSEPEQQLYSHLRYARHKVKRELKSRVNPSNMPKPNQYHIDSGNTPRDLRTSTPRGSAEPGKTFCQLCPKNSFTDATFCAYISGEIQYPQIHHFVTLS
jgi:hypothetical protein